MNKQIKNLIFDMGNVLMKWAPEEFLDREGITNSEDRELLLKLTFRSEGWMKLDRGDWDEENLAAAVLPQLPVHLREKAHRLICHWDEPILPVEGMADLVLKCKDAGYGIYLLSNASRHQHDYWERVPGHELFDGLVVSADILKVKPDPAIYTYLLDTYHLKAEECLFIDDMPRNTNAAEPLGFNTYVFNGNTKELENYIFNK